MSDAGGSGVIGAGAAEVGPVEEDAGGATGGAAGDESPTRLATGCGPLDDILGGGVEKGALTELFGEAGSGKTNVCLQLAREAASREKRVAFIDTEGVSVERLRQICGEDFDELSRRILFFEAYGMKEQEEAVDKAARVCASGPDVGLLVLDSSTIFYRMGLGGDQEGYLRHSLAYQLTRLLNTARKLMIPAVLTTQVYQDTNRDQTCAIGGHVMDHSAKAILRLEKVGRGVRRATLCKHRSLPEGATCLFYLTERGLEGRPTEPEAGEPSPS